LLNGLQVIVQAIELRVLTAPQRLILIKGNGGEALDQLVYDHVLEIGPLHGLRNTQIWVAT
jgi:hypothetical protein